MKLALSWIALAGQAAANKAMQPTASSGAFMREARVMRRIVAAADGRRSAAMVSGNMKMLGVYLLFFSILLPFCVGFVLAAVPVLEERGRVSGVVFDVNNARVTRALITFKFGNLKRAVETGEAGEFDVELPIGTYEFTVEANGFCRFESEPLRVWPGIKEMINVHLEVLETHRPEACKCSSRPRQKKSRGSAAEQRDAADPPQQVF